MYLSSLVVGLLLFALNVLAIKVSCSCAVYPLTAAVVAGDDFSLKCVTDSQSFVSGLYRDDLNGTVTIYKSKFYNNRGQLIGNGSVADGYSVDDESAFPNVTFTLNKSETTQAGYYRCQCSSSTDSSNSFSFASIFVSVLDSEPQFSSNGSSLSINDTVLLRCSVSFHGKADTSFEIFDGNNMMIDSHKESATSSMLQSPSITSIIPVKGVIRNDYSCNVILSNDSLPATAYNKTLKTTVRFSVRHTTIIPESKNDCHENGFCQRNMTMLCSAESSPDPAYYWTIYFNGSVLNSSGSYYYTSNIGKQTIRCTAYNVIGGETYNDSFNFTTNVTKEEYRPTPPTASPSTANENKVPLIVGLVVGLGGGLIIILVIVIIVLWKRKKRNGMKSDNGAQQMEVSNGAGKPGKGKVISGGPMPDVMPTQQKTRGSDETILVENDIYARDSKAAPGHTNHIHTFDGGYSSLDDLDKK